MVDRTSKDGIPTSGKLAVSLLSVDPTCDRVWSKTSVALAVRTNLVTNTYTCDRLVVHADIC